MHGTFALHKKFFAKVRKDPSGCVIWIAAHNKGGYGRLSVGGVLKLATHVSWFLKHGVWPTQFVLHTCDTPACVKPDHLFEGTQADNKRDQTQKGRQLKGEQVVGSKLTNARVREIRRLSIETNITYAELATLYGVGLPAVYWAATGKSWGHVSDNLTERKRWKYDVGGGERLTVEQIAEIAGVSYGAIVNRIERGLEGAALVAPKHRAPRRPYGTGPSIASPIKV